MRTVKFGDLDSYIDLGLIRNGVTIGQASPKTETVDVPGSDGSLDLTEYFGEIFYQNREIAFSFSVMPSDGVTFHDVFTRVKNALHGKRLKIILSEDADYYYVGRITCDEWKTNETIGTMEITADCDPYKYRLTPTAIMLSISGTATKVFMNERKRAVPTFELSSAMQIKQGTTTYQAAAGTWSDSRLYFSQGNNELTFTGTGTVKITYQEASL